MQAFKDSGLEVSEDNCARIGVAMGAGIGGLSTIEDNAAKWLETQHAAQDFAVLRPRQHHQHDRRAGVDPPRAARTRTSRWSPRARPRRTAIGIAGRLIQYGDADVMLAGGAEMAITPLGLGSFGQARALSQRNDEPAARQPSVGPGPRRLRAGRWRRRHGARGIRARPGARRTHLRGAVGFGMSGDAHHITAPPEDGEGARLAMSARHARCRHQRRMRSTTSTLTPPRPNWATWPRRSPSSARSAITRDVSPSVRPSP